MNMRRYTVLSLFLATTLVLAGCFDELSGGPYEGPDRVGFDIDLVTRGGPDDPDGASASFEQGQTVPLGVDLIGPQQSNDLQVNVSTVSEPVYNIKEVPTDTGAARIDTTVLAMPTTAEEGVHYDLPSSFTIPADSSTANLNVDLLSGLASDDDPVRLSIRLDGNEEQGLEPATNFRYFTINIQPN